MDSHSSTLGRGPVATQPERSTDLDVSYPVKAGSRTARGDVRPLLVPIAPTDPAYSRAKRLTDIVVSTLALIALSPVFLVIALAILTTSGRPITYRQTRLGLGGRPFTLYK